MHHAFKHFAETTLTTLWKISGLSRPRGTEAQFRQLTEADEAGEGRSRDSSPGLLTQSRSSLRYILAQNSQCVPNRAESQTVDKDMISLLTKITQENQHQLCCLSPCKVTYVCPGAIVTDTVAEEKGSRAQRLEVAVLARARIKWHFCGS